MSACVNQHKELSLSLTYTHTHAQLRTNTHTETRTHRHSLTQTHTLTQMHTHKHTHSHSLLLNTTQTVEHKQTQQNTDLGTKTKTLLFSSSQSHSLCLSVYLFDSHINGFTRFTLLSFWPTILKILTIVVFFRICLLTQLPQMPIFKYSIACCICCLFNRNSRELSCKLVIKSSFDNLSRSLSFN